MRALPVLAGALLLGLAVSLPASAQDNDLPGCIRANPCEVIVDLDRTGIDLHQDEFTKGDWILLSVFNGDDVSHTLTVVGKDISITVPADDINDTRPFELAPVGTVTLSDSPTGDTAAMTVKPEESFSGSSTGSGKFGPSVAPVVLLAAIVGGALLVRRRK